MKRLACLMIICLPLLAMAQTSSENITEGGIKWTTGLSWEQVKQKAKAENKYIFIDAYTTWCVPCKMMDKTVFVNDTVGAFLNANFISVKVQMDRTNNDNEYLQSWYDDADSMSRRFMIEGYPTAIFLSPDAKIVHKDGGFKPVQDFINMANLALTPGKVYDDSYLKFQNLKWEYKQGIKYYGLMAEMIKTAFRVNDGDFAREMLKDHVAYATTLNEKERYTKENIEVWSSFILKLNSKALAFFLKDGDKIDKVMSQKGYSRDAVDKTIQARIVDSFFRMQKEDATFFGKKIPNSEFMFIQLPVRMDGKIEPDLVEADWKMLESMISEHFNKGYTIRNLLMAKVKWYRQHQNYKSSSLTYFNQLLDKYPPSDIGRELSSINQYAWETFLYVNDRKLLNKALIWLGKAIKYRVEINRTEANELDTYANLLYKLGRIKEAISWEEKALALVKTYEVNYGTSESKSNYQLALEQMKKGEPTYLKKGAMWIESK